MSNEVIAAGLFISSALAIAQAVKPISDRLSKVGSLKERGGHFGRTFYICYELPQRIYRIFLMTLTFANVGAILGYIGQFKDYQPLGFFEFVYANFAIYILAGWALTGVVAVTNALSYIMLLIAASFRRIRTSSSWINAWRFSDPTGSPVPLVVRQDGISEMANCVAQNLPGGQGNNPHGAKKPKGLTDDERANTALFGCILETEHYISDWQLPRWRDFYECLSAIRFNGRSAFNPNVLREFDPKQSFFELIREQLDPCLLKKAQHAIPLAPSAAIKFTKALILLQDKHDCAATNLARRAPDNPMLDIALAFRRAAKFPNLDNYSMRPQCLKLMLVWDVWPDIEPGEFIYPYASNLAAYLVDEMVLITLDDVQSLSFASRQTQSIVQQAMNQIADKTHELLTKSKIKQYTRYVEKLKDAAHPIKWEIACETDFFLWSHSHEIVKRDALDAWRIEQKRLVRINAH